MKKIALKTILSLTLVFSLHCSTKAQLNLSINIGRQPAWGPTGYNHVDYYYLPDIESYYDVTNGQYIYQDGGRWIFANNLPPRYRSYDLYSGYKVVVNRPKPYLNFSRDRVSYATYRNWHGNRQPMLRESRNRTVINNTTNVRVNRAGNNGNHFGNGNNGGNNGRGNMGENHRNDRGNDDRGRDGNPHDDHGHGGDDHGHHQ